MIRGGAYTSIPLTIPNNTHITVSSHGSLPLFVCCVFCAGSTAVMIVRHHGYATTGGSAAPTCRCQPTTPVLERNALKVNINQNLNTILQVEEGASLVFDSAGADYYSLWVTEALPTYGKGQDAGGPLRYRAHLDCDGCRCGCFLTGLRFQCNDV